MGDFLNLTIDLHMVSDELTYSQTIYCGHQDRPWARVFHHKDHYSGIIAENDGFPLNKIFGPTDISSSYEIWFLNRGGG